MAGTPRRTYKKSAVTRQTILEAALELMKEKGYRGTTIREICTRAGTAVGSFYSYFDGKTDILRALYADGETYFSTVVRQETAGADTEEALRVFVSHYARLNIRTGVETVRVMYTPDNEWFARRKSQQEVLEEVVRRGQESGRITRRLEAARVVDDIFLCLRGVCYDWCSRNGAYDLEARMLECLELLLPGLRPGPEEEDTD